MASNGTAPVGVSQNIRQIGRMDLPGGGSIVVENGYAYVGHMDPPHGTSIIDVKDPKNPKIVAHLEIPEGLHSHKVRVSGDIMLINYERYVKQESPAAGLFGTAQGLLTVAQALLNQGTLNGNRFLALLTLKAMTTPQTIGVPLCNPDQDHMRSEWGLTFQLPGNREFIIGDKLFGHNGWGGCMFWMYPEQEHAFVLMTNLMDASLKGVDTDRIHNVFASCL